MESRQDVGDGSRGASRAGSSWSTCASRLDDATLVQRIALGDERASAELYLRLHRQLHGLALSIVRQRDDADDVLLVSFAKAWAHADRFDATRGTVSAWLGTIVRSRALDVVRARARRERTYIAALQESNEEHSAFSGTWDVVPQLEAEELLVRVRQAVTQLPQHQREVIEVTFWQGQSHVRTAVQLGIPLGTVKTRARLAVRRLRVLMNTA